MAKKGEGPSEGAHLPIRNSTVEFLIFAVEKNAQTIEVRYQNEMLWLTLGAIAELFSVDKSVVSRHLTNIFAEGELVRTATVAKYATVRKEGSREVERLLEYYNLAAIIAVGYRVNSLRATQFRMWATGVLQDFAVRGYVLDRKRLENGKYLGHDYFEHLLAEIREIRLSERRFYQKITDIYATAMDYDANSAITREFFAKVQNKLHYAVHRHTAAELIYERADAGKDNMGLTTWEKAPYGRIVATDVTIAKNYLTEWETEELGRIVNAYLELAESRARRQIPMSMEDWAGYLDKILQLDDRALLRNAGSISAEIARQHALSEFDKFRVRQELGYKNDFDRQLDLLEEQAKKNDEGSECL